MNFIKTIMVVCLLCLVTTVSTYYRGEHYTGFVYPDSYNIPNAGEVHLYTIGKYSSYDECFNSSIERVNSIGYSINTSPTFQCGFDCSKKEDFDGIMTCKYVGRRIGLVEYSSDKLLPWR